MDSGKITTLEDTEVVAWWSCSGRSSARSIYSHAVIFWTNFVGEVGMPGNEAVVRADAAAAGVVLVIAAVVEEGVSENGGSRLGPGLEAVDVKEGRPNAAITEDVRDEPREM